jgi:hypothetical protein
MGADGQQEDRIKPIEDLPSKDQAPLKDFPLKIWR